MIKDRLKEKSTWLTLITLIAGLFGGKMAPEHTQGITIGVISILSAIGVITKEK